jgi:putative SOS response-associated peptidase YedK
MCGRYHLKADVKWLVDRFQLKKMPTFSGNEDVRPTNEVPIVVLDANGEPDCMLAQWGLIPFWSKDPKMVKATFNARCETVAKLPSFREAYKRRHCVVPVSSYFEWPTIEGTKRKVRISMKDGSPFAFAGLWERWRSNGGDGPDEIISFTIITCPANDDMAPYHDRMPVILEDQHYEAWLEDYSDNAQRFLVPYLNGSLKFEPLEAAKGQPKPRKGRPAPDLIIPDQMD